MNYIFHNDGINQYIKYVTDNQVELDTFKYNMLATISEGILPCRILNEETLVLSYRVDGLITFEQYLLNNNITIEHIMEIFSKINQILIDLGDYLLDVKSVSFGRQNVFIDKKREQPFLIYLPIKPVEDGYDYRKWLIDVLKTISGKVNSGYLISELFSYINSAEFCVEGFQILLENQLLNPSKNEEIRHDNFEEKPVIQRDLEKKIQNNYVKSIKQLQKGRKTKLKRKKERKENLDDFTDEYCDATTVLAPISIKTPHLILGDSNKSVPLNKSNMILGRQDGNVDILIENKTVGRKHCKFVKNGDSFSVIDMFSRNGTYVNDCRVDVERPMALNNGDAIRVANVELKYCVD